MKRIKFLKTWDKQYPYIYSDKFPVEKGFGWTKGQRLDIDCDVENKRIAATESNRGMG